MERGGGGGCGGEDRGGGGEEEDGGGFLGATPCQLALAVLKTPPLPVPFVCRLRRPAVPHRRQGVRGFTGNLESWQLSGNVYPTCVPGGAGVSHKCHVHSLKTTISRLCMCAWVLV